LLATGSSWCFDAFEIRDDFGVTITDCKPAPAFFTIIFEGVGEGSFAAAAKQKVRLEWRRHTKAKMRHLSLAATSALQATSNFTIST
jgi:hypothetical protein